MRRRALASAVSGLLVTGVAAAGLHQGYPAAQIPLRAGVAWLASNRVGQLTLLDGSTAEVATRVAVARPGSFLVAAQQGVTGYAANRSDGSIVRVDGRTFQTDRWEAVLPKARDQLRALPAADSLYAFDGRRGTLAVADPRTLATRQEPLTLAAGVAPEASAVDARGRLWVLDPLSGDLVWVDAGRRRVRPGAGTPGKASLAVVGGRPVLVDPPRRRAELLDPESGEPDRWLRLDPPLDLSPGEGVSASGSPDGDRLYLVAGSRRLLVVCAFGTGSCANPVPLGSGPAEMGAAVESRGMVLVPDFTLGRVWIADPARLSVVAQPDVFGRQLRFELLVRDGVVFYNDPESEQAGVIELDGRVRRASKYDTGTAGDAGPGGPETGGKHPATSATQPTNGSTPGQVGGPPTPAPGSAAGPPGGSGLGGGSGRVSIEARPGLRGQVGQQFTFTVIANGGARITSARWTFADGGAATGATVRHRWQRAGTFTVTVSALLGDGRRPLASVAVVVGATARGGPPEIRRLDIGPGTASAGKPVHFAAVVAGVPPQRWTWSVVHERTGLVEVTSNAPQFDHTFTTSGRYRVTLQVTKGAASDRMSKPFTVQPPPVREVGCGATITEHTTLADDVGPCETDGLIIGASGVILDLGGHRIFDGSGTGVRIEGTGAAIQDVTVHNGTIEGFFLAVNVHNGRSIKLSSLRLLPTDNMIGVSQALAVSETRRLEITNSRIQGHTTSLAATESSQITVTDSTITGGGTSFGPDVSKVLLTRSTLTNNLTMVRSATDVSIVNNKAFEASEVTVLDSREFHFRDNKRITRGYYAVSLSGEISRAEITGNAFDGNQIGMVIGSSSDLAHFRDVRVSGNTFRRNKGPGVLVNALSSADSVRVVISDNEFTSNGFNPDSMFPYRDGLHVRVANGPFTPSVRVAGNRVTDNAGHGIYAQPGTVEDGTDNKATRDTCSGVRCRHVG